jgi:hypothetical protein
MYRFKDLTELMNLCRESKMFLINPTRRVPHVVN